MMKEYINKIIHFLKKLNRLVVDRLKPGLPKNEIINKMKCINLDCPDNLLELYMTINGTIINKGDIYDDMHFFPGFYLLSIDDAINYYISYKSDNRWNPDWFPVFANGGGDFYCFHLNDNNVIGFMLDIDIQPVEFLNLTLMFKTILKCFEEKAYYLYEGKYLEIDIENEKRIAALYNPGLERWLS